LNFASDILRDSNCEMIGKDQIYAKDTFSYNQ